MAQIELHDVNKRYADGFEAVRHFNLVIHDGELMVLVGPSGSGKSTVLRMVAGLEDISEGELKIDGEVVNDRSQPAGRRATARRGHDSPRRRVRAGYDSYMSSPIGITPSTDSVAVQRHA